MGHEPVPSKAAIKGHPLHPVMIPFPIAFGASVVFTDAAYWLTDSRTWALASVWLLWATVGTGLLGGELSYKHLIGANPSQSEPGSPLLGSRRRSEP